VSVLLVLQYVKILFEDSPKMATQQQNKKPVPAKPAAVKAKQTANAKQELNPAEQLQDVEERRTRLKALILLGKERGYLTFAEINDH
jgi:RNA polymerase primary sigma factor